MNLRRAWAIALRQMYLYQGSVARLVPLVVWVAIDMILWGFITRYLNSVSGAKMNFVPTLLGAVLLWDFFIRVMQGVTMAFFEDVWSRNFLNIFATPLRTSEFLMGLTITSVATSAVGLVVMLILSTAFFGLSFLSYGLPLIPFLLVLYLFGIALGIFGCALVFRLGPASEWFVWPIPALISPFAGVFYPVATLPVWMQWVSRALAPSYVFEGVRTIVAGGEPSMTVLAGGVALAAVTLALSYWFFASTYRRAVRTGLIARYSAESIS
ncbi:ABC transporter permease [soil metagenome]